MIKVPSHNPLKTLIVDEHGESFSVMDAMPHRTMRPSSSGQSSTSHGNAINKKTGMGGTHDLDVGTVLVPKDITQEDAEATYQMSWAAQRIVNIIIDDMFAAGRRWINTDEGINKAMEEGEADLKLWERLPNAIRAARIYGTALLIVCPTDGDFSSPMEPYEYYEGSIANLLAVDKHSLEVQSWELNPSNPGYGTPHTYRWTRRIVGSGSGSGVHYQNYMKPGDPMNQTLYPDSVMNNKKSNVIDVHHSRVFRFDGHPPPTTEGWKNDKWSPTWGVSVMLPALHDILRDIAMINGVGHLVGQSSVIVHQIDDFRTYMAMTGMNEHPPPMMATPDRLGKERARTISNYNTMYMDSADAIHRMEANFNGLQNILQQQTHRIAAIAGIPVSRFLGIPATGMNATGDGEARDWRITVEAYRKKAIDPILTRRLDIMVARHVGLDEPPEWEWNNLGEMTDQEKAQLAANNTSTIVGAYKGGLIDEDEARDMLSRMDFWPQLIPWGGPSVYDDYKMQQLQMDSQAVQVQKQKLELAAFMAQMQGAFGPPGQEEEGEGGKKIPMDKKSDSKNENKK